MKRKLTHLLGSARYQINCREERGQKTFRLSYIQLDNLSEILIGVSVLNDGNHRCSIHATGVPCSVLCQPVTTAEDIGSVQKEKKT